MTSQQASAIRPLERGGTFTRIVLATLSILLLLTMLMPALASPARAQVVPGDPPVDRSIEIFHNREMVSIVGYEPGSTVMIEVVRNGATVGAVTRTVFPDGTYEINHTGAGANDCWGPGVEGRDDPAEPGHPNVTPDIQPGDAVRTTVLELADGTRPVNDVNEAVTRDVYLDFDKLVAGEGDPEVDGDGTVTVQGRARSLTGAEIDFSRGDVVGIGLRKENRDSPWGDGQDGGKVLTAELTASDIGQGGNFTHTFRDIVEEDIEDVQTNGVSQSIEWTPAVVEPDAPPELTVYDASEGALPGCPPVEGARPVEEPTPNVNQDLSPSADLSDPVEEGRTMEIVYGIEFVVLEGYPAKRDVRVDVVRGQGENAVVVGSTTQRTDSTGLMEINHLGGGQFPGGDCWAYPGTPDIRPGDTVVATVLSPDGTPAPEDPNDPNSAPDVDTLVVRDVFLDTDKTVVYDPTPDAEGGATITLQGHVRDVANGPVEEGSDVLELRLNANGFDWQSGDRPGRKDMRAQVAGVSPEDGSFTHVFPVTDADARNAESFGFEQGLEWSPAFVEPAEPGEIVVYNGSDLESTGCPPHMGGTPLKTVANAITGSSHKYVNDANKGQGRIVLSGVAFGMDEVHVSVLGQTKVAELPAESAEGTTNGLLRPVDTGQRYGLQTWRVTFEGVDLDAGLERGEFEASAIFKDLDALAADPTAAMPTDTAKMMKDVDPPAAPTASLPQGEYTSAQRVTLSAGEELLAGEEGDRFYYSTSGASDAGENVTDALYTSPILVNESQTITAVAVDRAGNVSAEASFAYTIVPPPNALPTITNMTPADGTTVRNKRSTVAATVKDEGETNLSRNDIRLTIRGEEIRTFSYDRATDRLTYTPRKNFSVGRTPVRIVAVDQHGGRARADWTFTVRR